MAFFQREKSLLRNKSSQYSYDHDQHYHDMLNGLSGDITFGRNSGFAESPYETFRQNVAKYCERLTYGSFSQGELMSSEEKALRALSRIGEPCFNAENSEGDASRCFHAEHVIDHAEQSSDYSEQTSGHSEPRDRGDFREDVYLGHKHHAFDRNGNSDCSCSGNFICDFCQARPSKSNTNIFSMMSLTFEPLEDQKKKPSLLKKITHLMNSDYNSHKETVKISQNLQLKQRCKPSKWNTCECNKHVGKHSNCCQCQEPYHRTNCECLQHRSSHQFCCKCDPHLLQKIISVPQEYDQHLKKKRYLRLLSDDEELSPVNSVDHQDEGTMESPRSLPRAAQATTGCCNKKQSVKEIFRTDPNLSEQSRPATGDRNCNNKDDETREANAGHHPCEACCEKLDNIYGTALREVHGMLMEVSRTLLPSSHCCSLETRIPNVSRLRPSLYQIGSQKLETVESNSAEPEWMDISGTNEIGVQVNSNDIVRGGEPEKNTKKMKRMKRKCVIS